jgi:cellulose synthase (UDP-forming)
MLSHYNQSASFVAAAGSQRNDGFFGPMMLGLNGIGCVQAFGSNCIFRRAALESIGGYRPGLAEDLHTSIQLHAKGWQSAYVPGVLAKGLEPADLAGFYKQQFKWSLGVFDILWKIFPRLSRELNLKMNIGYLWRLTCFLTGPAIAGHIVALFLVLCFGSDATLTGFSDYLNHSVPLAFFYTFITFFVDKNYSAATLPAGRPGSGMLLVFGSWPIYTLSFIVSVLRINVPFTPTPKETRGGNYLRLVLPQIITVCALCGAMLWRFDFGKVVNLPVLLFGAFIIALHGGVFYAVYEGWQIGRGGKSAPLNKTVMTEISY